MHEDSEQTWYLMDREDAAKALETDIHTGLTQERAARS